MDEAGQRGWRPGTAVVRTYAPRGQTPILRRLLSHDHLSAISGITARGKLYMNVQEQAYRSEDVVRFLQHLLRHIAGKLLVIWDRAPIHRGQLVQEFLATGEGKRIHLERLPRYAPELKPDEGIWRYLKRRSGSRTSVLVIWRGSRRSCARRRSGYGIGPRTSWGVSDNQCT